MRTKKKIVSFAAAFCAIACGCAALRFADGLTTKADSPVAKSAVEYEYALLGETYTIKSGFLGGKTPQGETIDADTKSVFLDWASGSYVFEYAEKTVDLKVYESSPIDSFALKTDLEETLYTGERYTLPKAEIISGIYRTDGAPEVGEYDYSLIVKNADGVVADFQQDETFSVLFTRGGEYTLSYEYTNVFNEEKFFERKVFVNDKKSIIFNVSEEYCVGETLPLSEIYGSFMGVQFPAELRITAPSGKTIENADTLLFSESGEYLLSASCSFGGGSILTSEKRIAVIDSLSSFLTDKKSMSVGQSVSVSDSCITNEKSLLTLTSVGTGIAASYNGVVDLRTLGKNKAFISVIANRVTVEGITGLKITLTDVYDSGNALSVNISKNCDRTSYDAKYSCDNALISVSYGSLSTAFNNYYPLKGSAVAWDGTFHSVWADRAYKECKTENGFAPFTFSYDVETNKMYAYGKYNTIGRPEGDVNYGTGWYLLADLNDKTLAKPFGGFTTGEVYLRIESTGGVGDLGLINFGGVSASSIKTETYQSASEIFLGDFDDSIVGVVGKTYPLPNLVGSKYLKNAVTVELIDPNGQSVAYSATNFVPKTAGTYTIVYHATNAFGRDIEKTASFRIVEKATEITVEYARPSGLVSGAAYEVNTPVVSGGNGALQYTMRLNGEEVSAGDIVRIDRTFRLEIVAKDAFGGEKTEIIEEEVDTDVLFVSVDMPRNAAAGSKFVAPDAKIYSYAVGLYIDDYKVMINGIERREATMPTNVGDRLSVRYITEYGSKSFDVYAVAPTFASGAEVLRFSQSGSAQTFKDGTEATVRSGEVISFPYAMSSNELSLETLIRAYDLGKKDQWGNAVYELNYNSLTYTLTGADGRKVVIGLKNLNNDEINVYINGKDSGKTVAKVRGSYEQDESLGDWSGATYYKIVLQYDDVYRMLFTGQQFVCDVTTDSDGVVFNGFGGGVFLEATLGDYNTGVETASVVFTRISNQSFGASAFKRGDIVGPAIYSDGVTKNRTLQYGETVNLSSIKGYDVLSGVSTTDVEFISPSGKSLSTTQDETLTEYGTYVVKVTLTDANGKFNSYMYTYVVEDTEEPVLRIDGMQNGMVKQGDKIKIAGASATDNIAVTRVYVTICLPDYTSYTIADGETSVKATSIKATMKGVYKVQYFALDAQGNVTSTVYVVEVK